MRVVATEGQPFETLEYRRLAQGGRGVETVSLPFYMAHVDTMPPGLTAIVATSDLQGVEAEGSGRLLGYSVAERCVEVLERHGVRPERTGVLLAGDLHSDVSLSRRGGFGDVRVVWGAFLARFKWVAGVAGNHDTFGSVVEIERFRRTARVGLLDGASVVLDGLRISGVSGVIGENNKPWRHPAPEHLRMLQRAVGASPAILVLHEGPSVRENGIDGSDQVRRHLEACRPCFVICGHRPWSVTAMQVLANGTRVLSVAEKIIVFRKKWPSISPHA